MAINYKPSPAHLKIKSPYTTPLFDKLSSNVSFKAYPVGSRFFLTSTSRKCYLIRSGMISVFRQPDDVLIGLFEAPSLRGIIELNENLPIDYIFKVVSPAEIASLEIDQFYSMLTEFNLWKTYAYHLQFMLNSAANHLFKISAPSAYDIIRLQLYDLMNEPQEFRANITAERYISNRTRISRSATMRILSELRSGNYIIIKNGILIDITTLPDKY